jgi:uncharacterized protein involved in tolerance to divalent cations
VTAGELCEVVIAAPDPEWLKAFSRQLVEDRLCASAHNFTSVQSIYRRRRSRAEEDAAATHSSNPPCSRAVQQPAKVR